jgi:hypothetical protein
MIYMSDDFLAAVGVTRQPLNHSRILWLNLAAAADVTASSEAEGFEALRARSEDCYSWWIPTAPASLTIDFGADVTLDCIALACHTLGSAGVTLTAEAWDGFGFVEVIDPISPGDDEAIMLAFDGVVTSAIRLSLDGIARIATVQAGVMLEMPRPGYSNLPPLMLQRSTQFNTNKSVRGTPLGTSIQSSSRQIQPRWRHLTETWVRAEFNAFARAAREHCFFLALRPGDQPEDVGYVWTTADITSERMGVVNLMQVQIAGEVLTGLDA